MQNKGCLLGPWTEPSSLRKVIGTNTVGCAIFREDDLWLYVVYPHNITNITASYIFGTGYRTDQMAMEACDERIMNLFPNTILLSQKEMNLL